MIAALLPLIGRVGASAGANLAVRAGATQGGFAQEVGSVLGRNAAISAARHLSSAQQNNRSY